MNEDKNNRGNPLTRPARPEDFLILLRNRTYIARYVERLEAYGVQAEPSGSRADAEELRALCQLIKTLQDPSDRIPLLAVLRGPLFGVSDNALYHYRMEEGTFNLYSLADDSASFGPEARSAWDALRQVRKYLDLARFEPGLTALLKIVDDLGLIPSAAAGESGAVRSGTLISVLEQLQQNVEQNEDWQISQSTRPSCGTRWRLKESLSSPDAVYGGRHSEEP